MGFGYPYLFSNFFRNKSVMFTGGKRYGPIGADEVSLLFSLHRTFFLKFRIPAPTLYKISPE